MLLILATLFDCLKAQAPIAEAYDALTLQMNTNLQKVFDRLSEFQSSATLASVVGPSDVRGGEGPRKRDHTISWKPALEFKLWDESDDDDVQIVSTGIPYDDDE